MKKKIAMGWIILLMGVSAAGADTLNASAENFKLDKVFKLANGKISNRTMYSGSILCNIPDMKTFAADFKLTLLPKPKKDSGFFSVTIDTGNAKWSYMINTAANGGYSLNKIHFPADKTVRRQYFKAQELSSELLKDILDIHVEFKDGVFKIKFADQEFEQKLNAAAASLSFGSYRQPVEISDLKISYEKDNALQQ